MRTKLNLLLFVITLGFAGFAQTNGTPGKVPETMIIKLVESNPSFGQKLDSKMIIVKSDNQTEVKVLKSVDANDDKNDGIANNTLKLREELQAWQNKGFVVKSMASVSPRTYLAITTIILQKD